jgi:hypothetical protein
MPRQMPAGHKAGCEITQGTTAGGSTRPAVCPDLRSGNSMCDCVAALLHSCNGCNGWQMLSHCPQPRTQVRPCHCNRRPSCKAAYTCFQQESSTQAAVCPQSLTAAKVLPRVMIKSKMLIVWAERTMATHTWQSCSGLVHPNVAGEASTTEPILQSLQPMCGSAGSARATASPTYPECCTPPLHQTRRHGGAQQQTANLALSPRCKYRKDTNS